MSQHGSYQKSLQKSIAFISFQQASRTKFSYDDKLISFNDNSIATQSHIWLEVEVVFHKLWGLTLFLSITIESTLINA